jgi:phosphoribosylglycinamide formyltransferase 2
VIVEEFVDFDYEITLLTVRAVNGVFFLEPIGHTQIDGDYRTSWQPAQMSATVLKRAQEIAEKITSALVVGKVTAGSRDESTKSSASAADGWGVFGVELFIKGNDVIFSEVSPRPHDTGMVTMISQEKSEFALHARAILGLPISQPRLIAPSASYAILAHGHGTPEVGGLPRALRVPESEVRVFGKPEVHGERRVAVALARGESVEEARARVEQVAQALEVRCVEANAQSAGAQSVAQAGAAGTVSAQSGAAVATAAASARGETETTS